MKITAKTKICMVIGDPVEHSLSPQIHNAGFEVLGIDTDYVYTASLVKPEALEDCVKGVRAMNLRGISCTIPHKIEVMKYLDEIDEVAQTIGAVNTIVNDNGHLKGYNTDWLGVIRPLEKITSLAGKTVALIGAGGAARAAAYALGNKDLNLSIYNRTLENAQKLAEEFDGTAFSLDHINRIKDADIIVNTTSLGLHPKENESPVSKELITNKHIVFDLVYKANGTTKLIEEAKEQGATTISGIEMLLSQGYEQFKLFTKLDAPEEAMRKAAL